MAWQILANYASDVWFFALDSIFKTLSCISRNALANIINPIRGGERGGGGKCPHDFPKTIITITTTIQYQSF